MQVPQLVRDMLCTVLDHDWRHALFTYAVDDLPPSYQYIVLGDRKCRRCGATDSTAVWNGDIDLQSSVMTEETALEELSELIAAAEGVTARGWGHLYRDQAVCAVKILRDQRPDVAAALGIGAQEVTWNTSCTSCSAMLDASYRETVRAEVAEEALRAITHTVQQANEAIAAAAAKLEQGRAA